MLIISELRLPGHPCIICAILAFYYINVPFPLIHKAFVLSTRQHYPSRLVGTFIIRALSRR